MLHADENVLIKLYIVLYLCIITCTSVDQMMKFQALHLSTNPMWINKLSSV